MSGIRRPDINKYLFLLTFLLTSICFAQQKTFTQVSTINALMGGAYDGSISVLELKRSGNYGIGTFDALNGEMIMIDGKCYRIKHDGGVETPQENEKIPFASVTAFHSDIQKKIIEETNLKGIENKIEGLFPAKNLLCAIKIKGKFKLLTARSVPRQQKPYLPLIEVVKKQSEFKFENVEGTIFGFKCPSYLKGLNVPGYHFHFISEDRKKGGHVLNFIITEADLEIEKINNLNMIIPEDESFLNMDLESDKEQEIKKVEK